MKALKVCKITIAIFCLAFIAISSPLHAQIIYGLNYSGGPNYYGSIFSVNPDGTYNIEFDNFDEINGKNPFGKLVFKEGKFYGMTRSGGLFDGGVIFEWDLINNTYTKKIDLKGTYETFQSSNLFLKDGIFYGTTGLGGTNNLGTIFEWNPETNVYSERIQFNGANGYYPCNDLVFKNDKFYGITLYSGIPFGQEGGLFFEWNPDNNELKVLLEPIGESPLELVVFDEHTFYGTRTLAGNGNGTIIEINIMDPEDVTFKNKIVFDGNNGDDPFGKLLLYNGNYYGVSNRGGSNSSGVLFEWNPITNVLTNKLDFPENDAEFPVSTLVLHEDKFIGMTRYGGFYDGEEHNNGVIFEWDPSNENFRLIANLDGGLADYSERYTHELTVIEDLVPPSEPILTLEKINETTVELNWTASVDNIGVIRYDIYQGGELIGTTSELNFLVTDLIPCTEYTFSVAAKDEAGNAATSNEVVRTIDDELHTLTLVISQEVSSPGASDGAIDLTVLGGNLPFTYEWSNGSITEDISDLPAGDYSVMVTDANGCIVENEITLENPQGTCFVSEIIDFNQGKKKNGRVISDQRSYADMATNAPQENDTYNFVALGFGGSITLKLGNDLYDDGTYEPDLIMVETSFGRADQMCYTEGMRNYPEMAFVEVSEDNQTWYSLPNAYCRTSFVDISPAVDNGLSFVRYLRITDASNRSWFGGNADGYDVDGIITCRQQVQAAFDRLTNARTHTGGALAFDPSFINRAPDEEDEMVINIYPNPVGNQILKLEYLSEKKTKGRLKFVDQVGHVLIEKSVDQLPGLTRIDIDVSGLPTGYYILMLNSNQSEIAVRKIIKYE